MEQPRLIIFAGANGSGKTTVARMLLPKIDVKEFVNADEVAKGLSPFNPSGQAVRAGRLVIKRRSELIRARKSFAIETTLSGNSLLKDIKAAKDAGYLVEMHYIFCADVEVNIARVANRVKQGGHDVPRDHIIRRYWRSLKNWSIFVFKCDKMVVYDATAGAADVINEAAVVYDLPLWTRFINKVEEALK